MSDNVKKNSLETLISRYIYKKNQKKKIYIIYTIGNSCKNQIMRGVYD